MISEIFSLKKIIGNLNPDSIYTALEYAILDLKLFLWPQSKFSHD